MEPRDAADVGELACECGLSNRPISMPSPGLPISLSLTGPPLTTLFPLSWPQEMVFVVLACEALDIGERVVPSVATAGGVSVEV